jgi:hypothetical protein
VALLFDIPVRIGRRFVEAAILRLLAPVLPLGQRLLPLGVDNPLPMAVNTRSY